MLKSRVVSALQTKYISVHVEGTFLDFAYTIFPHLIFFSFQNALQLVRVWISMW